MRHLLIAPLLVVGLLCTAGSARAVTLVTPGGQVAQPFQAWALKAKVPTAPTTELVTSGGCPGDPGRSCAVPATPPYPAEIWLCSMTLCSPRDDLYHELGHQFDYTVMTPAARAGFLKIIRRPVTLPWGGEPLAEPHEQFAEAYRICAHGWTFTHAAETTGIGYDYSTTDARQRRVCTLIRRVAKRSHVG